jgi:hypothetical protein
MALYLPGASPWAKDLVENGAEYMRISQLVEQGREEQRRAELRASAPPLTFLDRLYKDGQN